jgi:hypothetical protein
MLKDQTMQPTLLQEDFPCQPFSVAGKRKGTDDDRYLWDETIRVVAECKPSWFIGENVEGLININNGLVLRQVQTDLEDQGFQVQCIVIPASGIGAWHQSVKESGLLDSMLPTPTTMDHIDRKGMRPSRAATNRKTGYLSEMIKMYPTPTASCQMDVVAPPETVVTEQQRLDSNETKNWNEVRILS